MKNKKTKRIENHIAKALSAISMEFLGIAPVAQSGKAKEIDKKEFSKFLKRNV